MENFRSQFNKNIRFPEGSVKQTTFSTKAYKKIRCCSRKNGLCRKGIATLTIPAGSTVVRANDSDGKLRTDQVYVEKLEDLDGNFIDDSFECTGPFRPGLIYKTDSVIKPAEPLNTNINNICVPGIHLFLLKNDARFYF
ncbi:hypothetical protein QLL95_gp0008 [Cotonvirus japonicus]|uniref:Uncharacterized protein n=1 Tax=Cotonvirus japonicus TaxID=2811091 RepID=A0ABM7NQW1_9VIRU|nr:hypothetical protein QLL95_gp0008 [Cotonvirus japonicus]BCS82497.1 hypothetical protein [Cotonvirus japonicus]